MTELSPEHEQIRTTWSEYIMARIHCGIGSAALHIAEWVGERTEYTETEDDDE